VLTPENVKSRIGIGELESITLPVVNESRQSAALREHCCYVAILVGQVDTGDPAAELMCDAPGSASQATADVEDTSCRGDPGGASKLEGRFSAPNMELVDRGKVLGLEIVHVLSSAGEGIEDDSYKIDWGVVLLDMLI
jgi:hypothetical protein